MLYLHIHEPAASKDLSGLPFPPVAPGLGSGDLLVLASDGSSVATRGTWHSFSPQGKMLLEKEDHLPPKAKLMDGTLSLLCSPWDSLWVPFHTLHALELWVASFFQTTQE